MTKYIFGITMLFLLYFCYKASLFLYPKDIQIQKYENRIWQGDYPNIEYKNRKINITIYSKSRDIKDFLEDLKQIGNSYTFIQIQPFPIVTMQVESIPILPESLKYKIA